MEKFGLLGAIGMIRFFWEKVNMTISMMRQNKK